VSLAALATELEGLGRTLIGAAASLATKADPLIDAAANEATLLAPTHAIEAQAIKLVADRATALLQGAAADVQSGSDMQAVQDIFDLVRSAEQLIRN